MWSCGFESETPDHNRFLFKLCNNLKLDLLSDFYTTIQSLKTFSEE